MHLHGCGMDEQGMSNDIIFGMGFFQYAATNDIILILPQAEFSIFWLNFAPCFASEYVTNNEDNYLGNQSV